MVELNESSALPLNSNKGKGTDFQNLPEVAFNLGWEQVQALGDSNPKTLAWTRHNMILFGHATLPKVCARFVHPNASTPTASFDLQSPPLSDFHNNYGPPKLLTINGNFVFAYFPPALLSDGDGIGCIWSSTMEAGSWTISYWWRIQRGHWPVTVQWLDQSRQWILPPNETTLRREPELGTRILKPPMLLIVTRTSYVELVYAVGNFRLVYHVMRLSLHTSMMTAAGGDASQPTISGGHGGARICTKAAIGLTNDAESIVIACISKSLPRLDIYSAQNVGPLNLAELTQPQAAETWTDNTSWEDWNTESVINLTEIRITTHNDRSTMEVLPLAPIPISGPNEDSSSLGEAFLGGIEASHVSRLVLTSIGPVDDAASIEPDAAAIGRDSDTEQGSTIQLIGCFVDFGDYSSQPVSVLKQWHLTHRPRPRDLEAPPLSSASEWTARSGMVRVISDRFVSIIQPLWTMEGPHLGMCTLNFSTKFSSGQTEVSFGSFRLLNSALDDHIDYPEIAIMGHRDMIGAQPTSLAVSPNRALIAFAPIHGSASGLVIVQAPRRQCNNEIVLDTPAMAKISYHALASSLAISRLTGADSNDVYRAFWSGPDSSVSTAARLVRDVSSLLEVYDLATPPAKATVVADLRLDPAVLKLTTGLFKASTNEATSKLGDLGLYLLDMQYGVDLFDSLGPLWTTPDPKLSAVKKMLHDVRRLIGICERIAEEAVTWEAWRFCGRDCPPEGTEGPRPSNVLLLILHPAALNLLRDVVKRILDLSSKLGGLPMFQKALHAVVTGAKLDLALFSTVIGEITESNKKALGDIPDSASLLREALFSFSIPPEFNAIVNSLTAMISTRPQLAHKMALLVPSLEYPDPQLGRSIPPSRRPLRPRVTMTVGQPLRKVCLRCGQEWMSNMGDLMSMSPIGSFERIWRHVCWCGGRWMGVESHQAASL